MLQLLSLFCTSAGRADQVHVDLLSTVRKRLWADAATFSVQIEWDVERLPDLLMMLAQRLDQFASIISNISELADNRVLDGAIGTLCARLKVRDCLSKLYSVVDTITPVLGRFFGRL